MSYSAREIEYGTYAWLQQEVGAALKYPPNAAGWDHAQARQVDSIINSGYMQMLYPPPLAAPRDGAPAPAPHQWTFLTPMARLDLKSGESTYRLPDNFAGVAGDMTIGDAGDEARVLSVIPDVQLRQMVVADAQSGVPMYAAVRPLASDNSGPQQHEIVFYPTPDADMTLEYRYVVSPDTLSDDRQYPLGGRQYAELLLQSCLAVAEERVSGAAGVASGRYLERLAAAVNLDAAARAAGDDAAWPMSDAPDSLDVDRAYLERLVGRHMGFGPNPATWSHRQSQEVSEAIRSGLRRFYTPPVLPGERHAHQWSFLRPIGQLTTKADVWEYDLPDAFAMLDGPLTFAPDDSVLYSAIRVMGEPQLRAARARTEYSARPEAAAIRVADVADGGGTRWKVQFWPTPDDAYQIEFRYKTNPGLLSASASVPHGGPPHAQTIIEACLLAADEMLGVKGQAAGQRYAKYLELLKSSVSHDRISSTPDTLGQNYDRSGRDFGDNYRDYMTHVVTYNGVEY